VRGAFVAAQPAADLDPAGAFDHPVENDQIGHFLGGQHQRFIAIAGAAHRVAFVLETIFEQFRQRRIVFDQQKFGSGHAQDASSSPRRRAMPCAMCHLSDNLMKLYMANFQQARDSEPAAASPQRSPSGG
jgi:hypothetical protein